MVEASTLLTRRHASHHVQDNLVFEARKKSSTKQKKVCSWNLCGCTQEYRTRWNTLHPCTMKHSSSVILPSLSLRVACNLKAVPDRCVDCRTRLQASHCGLLHAAMETMQQSCAWFAAGQS